MRRRSVLCLTGAALTWPLIARAEGPNPVVGFLSSESAPVVRKLVGSFHEGLRQAGFVDGTNVVIEYRWAQGRNDQLPALAADLVRLKVNVIAAPGTTPAALAASQATATIPVVVFMAGDPVALGLVKSLSRPAGNVTGSTSIGGELAPKRLELVRELLGSSTDFAVLVNPTNPTLAEANSKAVQQAALDMGIRVHTITASTEAELEAAFPRLNELGVGGLVIAIDSFFTARREKLGELALRHRIAAIYQSRDFAEAGGVMSYGGSLNDGYRLVGLYTGRILKGENPADLPVQQPTTAELVVNLKAISALGLTAAPSLLARADEVIE